jgi:hypothetical protein
MTGTRYLWVTAASLSALFRDPDGNLADFYSRPDTR